MFCTNKKCGLFTIKELNQLSDLLKRYKGLCDKGLSDKYNNKYNNITDEKAFNGMFIHFDTRTELENFRIKIYKSEINLWLDSNTCCNGKGCGVEFK